MNTVLAKQLNYTEFQECVILVNYLEHLKTQGKVLLFTHIPNETFTKSWSVKVKNKRQGVTPGFPDYVIVGKNNLIFLEMKRVKGAYTSPHQQEWLSQLTQKGQIAIVCHGFDEAKTFIDKWL